MKGKLLFGKNIQHNLVHQERFYVSYPTYDTEHQLHLILYKTILLIKNLNSNIELKSRIGSLLLHFPEMPNIKVSASIFEKLIFNRKTKSYKKAIDIAKLLLLNFHPDVVSDGKVVRLDLGSGRGVCRGQRGRNRSRAVSVGSR